MDRRYLAPLLLTLALLPAAAGAGIAAVPSPGNSVVPECFTMCPGGELSTTVTVRDLANNPVAGSVVVLDFLDCPEILFCTLEGIPDDIDPLNRTVSQVTGPDGVATFTIAMSGTCTAGAKVFADGIQLTFTPVRVSTTDPLGDFVVGPDDQAYVTARVGTPDLTADLDCDGAVAASDVAFVTAHLGHNCLPPTPAKPGSWGKVKILYR